VHPDVLNGAWFHAIAYLLEARDGSEVSARSAAAGAGTLFQFVTGKLGDGEAGDTRSAALRVSTLWRLLASHPDVLSLALHRPEEGGMIREETIAVAAELDLVARHDMPDPPNFDPGEFIAALLRFQGTGFDP
jgi:hypothetical protein